MSSLLRRNMEVIGNPEEYDFEGCYSRLNPNEAVTEHDLVAAIIKHRGTYARIAAELGRSRSHIFNLIGRNEEYTALRDDVRQAALDLVEDGVFEAAIAGDGAQQRFLLTTLAKDRGFVTREERTGKDGEPIHTQSKIKVEDLDDETLMKIMAAGAK